MRGNQNMSSSIERNRNSNDSDETTETQERKLDEDSISALIDFFKLLDKWDRGVNENGKSM
jgi:hypothetical protein